MHSVQAHTDFFTFEAGLSGAPHPPLLVSVAKLLSKLACIPLSVFQRLATLRTLLSPALTIDSHCTVQR